jgi:hypothetical protein
MTRKAALNLAGDFVDVLSIHLARIESLTTAIQIGCDERMDPAKVLPLANLAEDQADKAQGELESWYDALTGKGS